MIVRSSFNERLAVVGTIVLLTALSYQFFPGHTYLQQDSQIYVAILEHLWNPAVLANDPVAVRHHVTFSVYDEIALALRHVTGLEFETLLVMDQLVHRGLGILGVYLIATAVGLSSQLAMLSAAIYALGAEIPGPAVLSVEYEPKPRASALPLVWLAVGCVAHGRYLLGTGAASLAFLYHPPTVYPFWLVYFIMGLWPSRPEIMKRRIYGLAPLAMAAIILFVFSRLQPGHPEPQPFLGWIDPELERLQKMRAAYVWVSQWLQNWIWHYLLIWAVATGAFLRVRKAVPSRLQYFCVGLPLVGMISVPMSYLLLDEWKWSLMTKFQPARAVLFVPVVAVILASIACFKAAQSRTVPEAFLWGGFAFAIPMHRRVSELLIPDLSDPLVRRRFVLMLTLAALAVGTAWFTKRSKKAGWLLWSVALVAPFLLIPTYGQVVNYRPLEHRDLSELYLWARTNTARDAVFLFPYAGKERYPGVFRARALRAVYVDWKGGGQVNMVKEFAQEWWRRWRETMADPFESSDLPAYAAKGIDYIVVPPSKRMPEFQPVFQNESYLVYTVEPAAEALK